MIIVLVVALSQRQLELGPGYNSRPTEIFSLDHEARIPCLIMGAKNFMTSIERIASGLVCSRDLGPGNY